MNIRLIRSVNLSIIPPFLGAAFAFSLPLFQTLSSIILGAWCISSLLAIKRTKYDKEKYLWVPVILYIIYSLSLFLNWNGSLSILEHKLSLILFPLIFYLRTYSSAERLTILFYFIAGLILSGFICLVAACFRSITWDSGALTFNAAILIERGFYESILYGGNQFFGKHLSIFHQTVYYSLYLSSGIAILLFSQANITGRWKNWIIAFFTVLIFLISNKAGIMALGIVFLIYIFLNIKNAKSRARLLIVFGISLTLLLLINPRTFLSLEKISEGRLTLDKNARYGMDLRLLSWDSSVRLISEAPLFGYGVGRTQEYLNEQYDSLGYIYPKNNRLNAHNQFLQLWLENGIAGLLLWILLLGTLFSKARDFSNPQFGFIIALAILLFVNSLFESLLSRYSGIAFVTFIYCFIISLNREKLPD